MATVRTLQPLLRSAPRLATRSTVQTHQVRYLNKSTSPSLYAAHATVTGARNGKVTAENLQLQLGQPKDLGGKGGATNPEELFAAGYGACFQSAMNAVAPTMGIKFPSDSVVDTTVHLIGSMKELDLGIRVDMKVKVKGISKEEVEKLVEKTKGVCPYSRATEGNVVTNVEVVVE
ncbi:hypothetical protein CKM354_000382300 [Cercospora kikuchii]|uniref:Organic hydroperoxide resistance protein n=1 Tax=Cercospora kikuchii TaxID=84275 RepID=A0A9P3FAX4_9PEZI|nr:uncharacterized protein CKM354_000382300 [Cercospora kikuchii]GIZ40488.1 hypothetical protein CKM354_000382300 [Cercospora kikuchii]